VQSSPGESMVARGCQRAPRPVWRAGGHRYQRWWGEDHYGDGRVSLAPASQQLLSCSQRPAWDLYSICVAPPPLVAKHPSMPSTPSRSCCSAWHGWVWAPPQVRRHGNSTGGEHWDQTIHMDTYYNPIPHFGYKLALDHSPTLKKVWTGAAAGLQQRLRGHLAWWRACRPAGLRPATHRAWATPLAVPCRWPCAPSTLRRPVHPTPAARAQRRKTTTHSARAWTTCRVAGPAHQGHTWSVRQQQLNREGYCE
jgi:hypothetical protein